MEAPERIKSFFKTMHELGIDDITLPQSQFTNELLEFIDNEFKMSTAISIAPRKNDTKHEGLCSRGIIYQGVTVSILK